jgi:transposase
MRSSLAGNLAKRASRMRMFVDPKAVFLYPKTVDFRRQFNGLALIVEQELDVPLMSGALFVFTNRTRKRLRILYWDNTGLAMWSKRLEQEVFKWPSSTQTSISLTEQQLNSLLGGFDIHGHQPLFYASAGL